MKKKKEIEYEEAPSGFVTMYNYKEPFMKFTEGFGFQGVLLFDGVSDKIQCHFCGEWFDALQHHLKKEHAMTAPQYKEKVGLMKTTALINESYRAKLIASGLDKRKSNLIKTKAGYKNRKRPKRSTSPISMERRNRTGTCPEQLLDRLKKIYYSNGGNFGKRSKGMSSGLYQTICKYYGSMKNAMELANLPYKKPSITRKNELLGTFEGATFWVREYLKKNNLLPTFRTLPGNVKKLLEKESITLKKLHAQALYEEKIFKFGKSKIRFTEEQLLGFLVEFKKSNGRNPSYSDAKRGLIPHLSRYSYHFGSWKKALKKAFN